MPKAIHAQAGGEKEAMQRSGAGQAVSRHGLRIAVALTGLSVVACFLLAILFSSGSQEAAVSQNEASAYRVGAEGY